MKVCKEEAVSSRIEGLTVGFVRKEVYHRELKQTCGIERCQARTARAQRNHIGMAIQVWLDKHKRRITEKITLYQQDWEVIKETISQAMCIILSPT